MIFLVLKDPVLLCGLHPYFLELSVDTWFKESCFIMWPSSLVLGTD